MKSLDQKIYLASKSPRRRELLRQIGVDFEVLMLRETGPRGPDVNEDVLPGEAAEAYVARVTKAKAEFGLHTIRLRKLPVRPLLAADTTVVVDGQILGKPENVADATRMLKLLSGRVHQVMTCVALHLEERSWHIIQTSQVCFNTLSDEAISDYCASPEPYDKAGAYGIQGRGAIFVSEINGSYSGIVGLPLFETAQLLQKVGRRIL